MDLYVALSQVVPPEITDMIILAIGITNLTKCLSDSRISGLDVMTFFKWINRNGGIIAGSDLLRCLTNDSIEKLSLKIYFGSRDWFDISSPFQDYLHLAGFESYPKYYYVVPSPPQPSVGIDSIATGIHSIAIGNGNTVSGGNSVLTAHNSWSSTWMTSGSILGNQSPSVQIGMAPEHVQSIPNSVFIGVPNLTGATGPTGARGPTGATGPTGPANWTNPGKKSANLLSLIRRWIGPKVRISLIECYQDPIHVITTDNLIDHMKIYFSNNQFCIPLGLCLMDRTVRKHHIRFGPDPLNSLAKCQIQKNSPPTPVGFFYEHYIATTLTIKAIVSYLRSDSELGSYFKFGHYDWILKSIERVITEAESGGYIFMNDKTRQRSFLRCIIKLKSTYLALVNKTGLSLTQLLSKDDFLVLLVMCQHTIKKLDKLKSLGFTVEI